MLTLRTILIYDGRSSDVADMPRSASRPFERHRVEYDESDITVKYTIEEVTKLFFVRSHLDDLSDTEKQQLLGKLNRHGLARSRVDSVQLLLCLMHEARKADPHRYLNEVFFAWYGLRNNTNVHLQAVAADLKRIGDFEPGSIDEAVHCAGLYRRLVSDLFDPYMSLVVASIQFAEGTFVSMEIADLGRPTKSVCPAPVQRTGQAHFAMTEPEPHSTTRPGEFF